MPFVPPYPRRHEKPLPPWSMFRAARHNLLEVWTERAFHQEAFRYTLFRRHLFVANSPDTVREAFIEDAANNHRKSMQQIHALKPLAGDGLIISDGETWRQRRRVVAPLTHISKLADLAPVMAEAAGERLAQWRRRAGQEVEMMAEMAELTADIISRAVFGSRLGREHAAAAVRGFAEYQAAIGQTDLLSLIGLPDSFPRFHSRAVKRGAERVHGVVDALIAAIVSGDSAADPSFARDLADKLGGGVALRNEAVVMFLAGHETTANTMAWAWYLLSQDPASRARLEAEVDALDTDVPGFDDLPKLPFVRAVIDETLRLYPPIPLQARRSAEDRTIAGREVPANSIVLLVPWLLHRHKALWEEPDTFAPERFLPGGAGAPNRYCYVPFSIGPRTCPGAAFALAEATICLAALARAFRAELRPGHAVMPICRLTLRPGDALPMRLVPRR